ncbi:MAG TPA: ABC transporter permease [Candidatus Dormibacteraeota bacterium]|nr:ABC transporter permease [Candidatus Dormibacteraeota bacterium]
MTTIDSPVGVRPAPERSTALARYTNLCLELAITQFKLKYTGSALGYFWSLLKPLMLFSITYVVFIDIFKVDRGANANTEFGIQLLLGIVIWTFFAEATAGAIASVASQGGLVRKAAFPHIVLVVASTLTALLTFTINLVLVVVVTWAIGHLHPGPRSVVALPLLVELYVLVLGISLLLAALFVYYRDVGHIWEVFAQLLFYGSAVVFPLSLLSGRVLPRLVGINPVAQIIGDLRRALVIDSPGVPWMVQFDGWLYVAPLVIVVATLVVGFAVFRRLSPHFAEAL